MVPELTVCSFIFLTHDLREDVRFVLGQYANDRQLGKLLID